MRKVAKKVDPMSLAAYRAAEDTEHKRRQAPRILEAFATEPQKYNAVNVHMYWEAIYLTSRQRLDRAREKEATDATMKYFGKKGESGRRLVQRYKKQVEDRLRGPMLPALRQHARDIEIYSRIYFTVNEAARLLEKTENIKVDLRAFRHPKDVVQPDSVHWAAAVFASAFVQRDKARHADQKRIKDLQSKIERLEREELTSTGPTSIYKSGLTKSK
jgi:hypothetical protein